MLMVILRLQLFLHASLSNNDNHGGSKAFGKIGNSSGRPIYQCQIDRYCPKGIHRSHAYFIPRTFATGRPFQQRNSSVRKSSTIEFYPPYLTSTEHRCSVWKSSEILVERAGEFHFVSPAAVIEGWSESCSTTEGNDPQHDDSTPSALISSVSFIQHSSSPRSKFSTDVNASTGGACPETSLFTILGVRYCTS
mmetsp:Transcript_1316/g.1886  ORF Transcript_1316/g.1886 Transcript_1316/m.1886 type:complete len:193 (-) Transcript_1316:1530-2108(-)